MSAAGTCHRLKHIISLDELADEDRAELKISPNVSLHDLNDVMSLVSS